MQKMWLGKRLYSLRSEVIIPILMYSKLCFKMGRVCELQIKMATHHYISRPVIVKTLIYLLYCFNMVQIRQ